MYVWGSDVEQRVRTVQSCSPLFTSSQQVMHDPPPGTRPGTRNMRKAWPMNMSHRSVFLAQKTTENSEVNLSQSVSSSLSPCPVGPQQGIAKLCRLQGHTYAVHSVQAKFTHERPLHLQSMAAGRRISGSLDLDLIGTQQKRVRGNGTVTYVGT